jgi:hypothetical protein
MSDVQVDIEGLFCVSKQYPEINKSMYLPTELFKPSVRRFKLFNLRETSMKRLVGKPLASTEYTGIVDVEGSLVPFFIKTDKVEKLRQAQESINSFI